MEDINIWRRKLSGNNLSDSGAPWLASSGLDSSPQYSPDGSQVAFRSNRTGPNEIWIAEKDGRAVRKLTNFGGPVTGSPRWSPDGKWITFDSRAGGNSDIWVVAAAGVSRAGSLRRLLTNRFRAGRGTGASSITTATAPAPAACGGVRGAGENHS
jgi:Tol biopolymer transport system component